LSYFATKIQEYQFNKKNECCLSIFENNSLDRKFYQVQKTFHSFFNMIGNIILSTYFMQCHPYNQYIGNVREYIMNININNF